MKINIFEEPKLQFNSGESVSAKEGITKYDVFGASKQIRRKEILLGSIGTDENNVRLIEWIEKCKKYIPGKPGSTLINLFMPFCGFNSGSGFKTDIVLDSDNTRKLSNSQIAPLLLELDDKKLIEAASDLYLEQVKFLSAHRTVDVIICVIPEILYKRLTKSDSANGNSLENNFRRALKAKCMIAAGKALQLIRESSLETNAKGRQDDATMAWNFCTALYYKANQIGPWRLVTPTPDYVTCYVGISFYRSRDKISLHTSLAQVFDDMGRSIILRGSPINLEKDDKIPHLNTIQSKELLAKAIGEFLVAMDIPPARVVVHKSSNFTNDELIGFREAINQFNVRSVDFVTIMPSLSTRLIRDGNYPPLRGTHLEIDSSNHLLYTRGTVEFYRTYPGIYIPQPLEIKIVESDTSPENICQEILGLTKMDWNNTQFDKKLPITLECAKNVGEIMKYINESDQPQGNYSFYM